MKLGSGIKPSKHDGRVKKTRGNPIYNKYNRSHEKTDLQLVQQY